MRKCLGLVAIVLASGCTSHGLPPVKKIDHIRILVLRMPDEKEQRAPRAGKLSEQKEIVEMMDWMHTINWSEASADPPAEAMWQPDGDISIVHKSGAVQNFSFYWDGNVIDIAKNRYLRCPGTDKLRTIVERVCK